MTLVDDRILEYIRENDSGSPTAMKREGPIHYSRQYVDERCRKLAKKGLLEHLGNGVYVITDDGEAYLDGLLDTQNWVYLDDENGPSAEIENGTEQEG
jgi:Mn-dependent DtxR family transcriptional regulator